MAILDWKWGQNSAPKEMQKIPWIYLLLSCQVIFYSFCRPLALFKINFFRNLFHEHKSECDLDPDIDRSSAVGAVKTCVTFGYLK